MQFKPFRRTAPALALALVFVCLTTFQNCSEPEYQRASNAFPAVRLPSADDSFEPPENAGFRPSALPALAANHPVGTPLTPAQIYDEYALGYSYADTVAHLQQRINGLDSYLSETPVSVPDTKVRDCTTPSIYLKEWTGTKSWSSLTEIAETFYYGYVITSHTSADQALSASLKAGVIKIADHMIAKANATNFYGLTYNGRRPLGWTPFNGGWDAFSNGTCSPKEASTTWASAHSMQTIVLAYLLTRNAKYRTAFESALSYYFPRLNTNKFFVAGYQDFAESRALFAKYNGGQYRVTPLYTVGGSRFQKAGGAGDEQTIRFHYHYDDPAQFAINVSAAMALAISMGAKAFPDMMVLVSDAKTGYLERSLRNVGTYSMGPIYRNLAAGNLGYADIDSTLHISRLPASTNYEAHTIFTLYHMARAGYLLNNEYFVNETERSANQIFAAGSAQGAEQVRLYCLLRQLSSTYRNKCRSLLAALPSGNKGFYMPLRASIALLQDPANLGGSFAGAPAPTPPAPDSTPPTAPSVPRIEADWHSVQIGPVERRGTATAPGSVWLYMTQGTSILVRDNVNVTSCQSYKFASGTGNYSIRARHVGPVKDAAGRELDNCVSTTCGTSPGMLAFESTNGSVWKFNNTVSVTAAATSHALAPKLSGARYLMLCRAGGGHGRDNIEVLGLYRLSR